MRKWSKQGFFNDADSNDSGFYKFSIRPRDNEWRNEIGFSTIFKMADCSERINLEFGPPSVYVRPDGGVERLGEAKRALTKLKARRKKVKILREAINMYCDKIEEFFDQYEEEVNKAIEKTLDSNEE